MASLSKEFGKLGTATKDAVSSILHAPLNMFKGNSAASTAEKFTAETFGKEFGHNYLRIATAPIRFAGSAIGGGAGYLAKKGAGTALWAIEQPFAWAMKGARHGVNLVGGAYRKAPLLMVPLTAVAGIAAYSSHARHKAEERTKAEQDAQFAAIEAQVLGGNQPQMPQQPQAVATTYQVTPEEAKILEERMKGGQGAPQTGHADNIIAAREAAATQQAPQSTAQL